MFAVNQKGRSHGVLVKEFDFEANGDSRRGKYNDSSNNKRKAIKPRKRHLFALCLQSQIGFLFLFTENSGSAMDLSPVLLGILFTLVLLCFVIFAKLYCYRSTTVSNDLHSDAKLTSNINYKPDAAKVIMNNGVRECTTKAVFDSRSPVNR